MKTKPLYSDKNIDLFCVDIIENLNIIPVNKIQAVITSPTYWGKRQFTKDPNEIGSESLESYVERNVNLYSNILQKMKPGGSLFVIIQDTYMGSGGSRSHHKKYKGQTGKFKRMGNSSDMQGNKSSVTSKHNHIQNKSLCGIPYKIALALLDMGFIWRQQIIWEKPNPMPENVQDRVWQSAEYILHFTNHKNYKFNKEGLSIIGVNKKPRLPNQVITASTEPKQNHSATFPEKIVEKLLLSVTDPDDLVFEPFLGSGTMLKLCLKHERKFLGCDINKPFVDNAISIIENYKK